MKKILTFYNIIVIILVVLISYVVASFIFYNKNDIDTNISKNINSNIKREQKLSWDITKYPIPYANYLREVYDEIEQEHGGSYNFKANGYALILVDECDEKGTSCGFLYEPNKEIKTFLISFGRCDKGNGSFDTKPGSHCSPGGLLKIISKFDPTQRQIHKGICYKGFKVDGLGNANSNSRKRYIYGHGTCGTEKNEPYKGRDREDLFGIDISDGCFRFPKDIIEYISENVPVGTPIQVQNYINGIMLKRDQEIHNALY